MKFSLSSPELNLANEKIKDFRKVVVVQLLIIILSLFLSELFVLVKLPFSKVITELSFFLLVIFYIYSLWDMLRNYTKSNILLLGILVVVIGVFIIHSVTHNPFYQLLTKEGYRVMSLATMFTIIIVSTFAIYFNVKEVSRGKMELTEKIWAAACLYLIIGIAFGALYEVLALIKPSVISFGIELSAIHFMKFIGYSFYVLGGIDNPYPNTNIIILNVSAIESVWGNLFIVFVIGRMWY